MNIENAFKSFELKFNSFPCISELTNISYDTLEKLTSKSHIIWYHKKFYNNQKLNLKTLFEYDSTGILIYSELNSDENKQTYNVFILSLSIKKSIVDFVINSINK